MGIYTTTKAGYDKLKQALETASEKGGPGIFVRITFGPGGIRGELFPIYHVENASVKLSQIDNTERDIRYIRVIAKSEFAEREAVSALEHLAVEQGLADRTIKLIRLGK